MESKSGISLTPYARLMLLLPLSEMTTEDYSRSYESSLKSLGALLETIQHDAARDDLNFDHDGRIEQEQRSRRSSLSVIKALWKNFCDIPPFCSGTEHK